MDARGWVPATGGNMSIRLGPDRIAITTSGVHKGMLGPRDVMVIDPAGTPLTPGRRASSDTLLHRQIYAAAPDARAVLHGHSVPATVLSQDTDSIVLEGYELLKALGAPSGRARVTVPVVTNEQDVPHLATLLAPLLATGIVAYVIRAHGTYVWGRSIDEAMARLEALEFLFACVLERRRLA